MLLPTLSCAEMVKTGPSAIFIVCSLRCPDAGALLDLQVGKERGACGNREKEPFPQPFASGRSHSDKTQRSNKLSLSMALSGHPLDSVKWPLITA